MSAGCYQQKQRKTTSEERHARERYRNLFEDEKSKKQENGCKQYKSNRMQHFFQINIQTIFRDFLFQ